MSKPFSRANPGEPRTRQTLSEWLAAGGKITRCPPDHRLEEKGSQSFTANPRSRALASQSACSLTGEPMNDGNTWLGRATDRS